jgi:hypothetical protein
MGIERTAAEARGCQGKPMVRGPDVGLLPERRTNLLDPLLRVACHLHTQ